MASDTIVYRDVIGVTFDIEHVVARLKRTIG